jgi:hypothetical protein
MDHADVADEVRADRRFVSEPLGRLAGLAFLVFMIAYALPTKTPGFSGKMSFSYIVGRTFDEWTFSWKFDGLRMASVVILWIVIGVALCLRVSERGRSFALGAVALFGLQHFLGFGASILGDSLIVSWTTYVVTAGSAVMLAAAIAAVRRPRITTVVVPEGGA